MDRKRSIGVGVIVVAVIVAAAIILQQWLPGNAAGDREGGPAGGALTSPDAQSGVDLGGAPGGANGSSGSMQTSDLSPSAEVASLTPRSVPIGKEGGATSGSGTDQSAAPPSGDQDSGG